MISYKGHETHSDQKQPLCYVSASDVSCKSYGPLWHENGGLRDKKINRQTNMVIPI